MSPNPTEGPTEADTLMFFKIVESIISRCSPQEFMRTVAPCRLAKLSVSTEIVCASFGGCSGVTGKPDTITLCLKSRVFGKFNPGVADNPLKE